MIRRVLHAMLAAVGVMLWMVLAAGGLLLVGVAVVGHRVWPDADRGDCWSYALPRWVLHGGALRISIHRVEWLPIPRATWVRPDGVLERAAPVRRARTVREAWYGARTLYFRYRVVRQSPPVPRDLVCRKQPGIPDVDNEQRSNARRDPGQDTVSAPSPSRDGQRNQVDD